MHFKGAAKRWLSSIEDELESTTWSEFCSQILARFAKDEHALLLRRLFQLRQTGQISEYVEQFVALVDQLKAYAKHPDPLYYIQRFIEGLRDEIKVVLLVQSPSSLDAACVLVQLQEDALAATRKTYWRNDVATVPRQPWLGHGAPLPAPQLPQPAGGADRVEDTPTASAEEKFRALRASRRARGLCIRCGAKWSRDHRCEAAVQLHMVQELLDVFPDLDDNTDEDTPDPIPGAHIMLHLSMAAIVGAFAPKTLCLDGFI